MAARSTSFSNGVLAILQAWTDAALALIDLELPMWQLRRIAYHDGEWYCVLSRECELPDWLDRSIEARHADLALGAANRLRWRLQSWRRRQLSSTRT